MKIQNCIECPKCHNPFLKSCGTNAKFGKEYFCHLCHTYFGVNELVNQWNYDAGDLYPPYPVTHGNYKNWIPKGNYPMILNLDYAQQEAKVFSSLQKVAYSEFDGGEPYWLSGKERNSAYQMVTRMFLDIPEYDDYADMLATQEDALGIGLQ